MRVSLLGLVSFFGFLVSLPPRAAAQEVVEVLAAPEQLSLVIGARQRLHLSAFDDRGNLADDPVYHLAVGDARIAVVEPDGSVVAVGTGTTRVVVTSGSGRAEVTVSVMNRAPPPEALSGSPAVREVQAREKGLPVHHYGSRPVIMVLGRDSLLSPHGLPAGAVGFDRSVRWSSLDTTVAMVSHLGRVTAVGVGRTEVAAHVVRVGVVSWAVTVKPQSLSLDPPSPVVVLGDSLWLDIVAEGNGVTVSAASALRGMVSSDSEVVAPGGGSFIYGRGIGRATLSLETTWGNVDSVMATVVAPALASVALGQTAGARLIAFDPDGPSTEVLLDDGATNLYASYSPDRSMIALASDPNGRFDLYLLTPGESASKRSITRAPGHHTQPVWSPDGTTLAFTSTRGGSPQLYLTGLTGTDIRQLTDLEKGAHSPAFSPDGQTVAFVSGRGPGQRVHVLDLASGSVDQVPFSDEDRPVGAPRYFPDGDLGAVVQVGSSGASAIVRYRKDGARLPVLTSNDRIESFAVDRDGRSLLAVIVSSSDHRERSRVLLVDLATRESRNLSLTTDGKVQYPSF